ncbi:hypothetical protein [Microbacterium sp. NPDC086615]|uniref:hypothetical protein n=1 Tax=Microbacterium sp. NPDC086615 TaxID=3154865 RepID=UPI00341C62FE
MDLCESTPCATLKGIAVDLGISRGALKEWVDKLGSGTTAIGGVAASDGSCPDSQAARVVRLEAENTALKAEARRLETERDILRQAAKYFAGETNW